MGTRAGSTRLERKDDVHGDHRDVHGDHRDITVSLMLDLQRGGWVRTVVTS